MAPTYVGLPYPAVGASKGFLVNPTGLCIGRHHNLRIAAVPGVAVTVNTAALAFVRCRRSD